MLEENDIIDVASSMITLAHPELATLKPKKYDCCIDVEPKFFMELIRCVINNVMMHQIKEFDYHSNDSETVFAYTFADKYVAIDEPHNSPHKYIYTHYVSVGTFEDGDLIRKVLIGTRDYIYKYNENNEFVKVHRRFKNTDAILKEYKNNDNFKCWLMLNGYDMNKNGIIKYGGVLD